VPSKVFLDRPFPNDLATVDICAPCNESFSRDEEYMACFLECASCGTSDPDRLRRARIAERLRNSPKLRERIACSAKAFTTRDGQEQTFWYPELARVRAVLVKNARGHVLHELNEMVRGEPTREGVSPLEAMGEEMRGAFERVPSWDVWPEVGSRAMQRMMTGEGVIDGWIVVQDGNYRYAAACGDCVVVRIVVQEYLAAEFVWEG
jgi:hypothetical protein